jgi:hypothetical protein
VTTSQTRFLTEIAAGHAGPPIPMGKRAYFQQRLRIRVFNFLLEKFVQAQKKGLNKNILAKRIGRPPEVINRWLGTPSNLTLDSISDLLLGIAGEELELGSSSPLGKVANNYSHFDEMASAQDGEKTKQSVVASAMTGPREDLGSISKAQQAAYGEPAKKATEE